MRAYLAKTKPNSPTNRVPWYRYTLPVCGASFLWAGFAEHIAEGTIRHASLGIVFLGIVLGGAFSYALLYYIPSVLGMQTGYPAGVIGSSTFGSRGGLVVPGLVLGLVQAMMMGAAVYHAATLVTIGAGGEARPTSLPFAAAAAVWCALFALLGARGIPMAARLALWVSPILLLLFPAFAILAREGLPMYGLEIPAPFAAFTLSIQMVVAYFAVIGASAPALGLHLRSKQDVRTGGITGVIVPSIYAGGLTIITVAGAHALNPSLGGFGYIESALSIAGPIRALAPWLLLIAGAPVTCLFAALALDSFGAMMPSAPRSLIRAGVPVFAFAVALSGLPASGQAFLTALGAVCAPFCGIMAADFWQHDNRWPHTRPGINLAGFGAWAIGLLVGFVPLMPVPEHIKAVSNPAALYACLAGFLAYILLGNLGLKPYQRHRRRRVKVKEDWEEGRPPSLERWG